MSDNLQEQALALLKQAKGNLDPAVKEELANLIASEARPELEKAIKILDEAKKRELSPEIKAAFFLALETRLAQEPKHYKRPYGVKFAEVKAAIEANTVIMYSLVKMEETGGEPDVIGVENDAFIFGDCSAESPYGRRNMGYHKSARMASEFGVDIMSEDTYRAMQKLGEFDMNTFSWINTPEDHNSIKYGGALCVRRGKSGIYVTPALSVDWGTRGWRGVLRVPRAFALISNSI